MKQFLIFILLNVYIYSQNIDSLSIKKTAKLPEGDKRDSVLVDTTGLLSKKKNLVKVDTLLPLQQKPLTDDSYFISHKTIFHFDYRSASDLLKEFPFTFIKDKGFIEPDNEAFMYGAGAGGISFLQDGILYNDRFTNSLNLYNIQTGSVDSIEIVPSPRGFLYSISPNPVTINFITKDYLSVIPYSRIKYYQGPSGETYVDGLFSVLLLKNLNVSFDVTNRNIDSSFVNSNFNMWQVKSKLKYFLSNSLNITGSYGYIKSEMGLNGGINADTIYKSNTDINSTLYNDITAPINFPSRKEEYIQHYFNIGLLSKAFNNFNGNLDLYFRFNQDKISGIDSSISEIKNKNKIYGVNLREEFSKDLFKISILGNYEHINYNTSSIINRAYTIEESNLNNLSLASVISLNLLNGELTPSIFYKYYDGKDYYQRDISLNGFGADVAYNLKDNFKFYLGYSNYEINKSAKKINNAEASISYSAMDASVMFKIFNRDLIVGKSVPGIYNYDYKNITGLGLKLDFKFKEILIETSGEYYLNPGTEFKNLMPGLNFMSGIYYKGILFNTNLNLKTGFIFYYTGKQNLLPVYSPGVLNYFNNEIAQSLTVDFTLVGEIRKVAIVYFTWENLFNKQYFITPFYPMWSRGIRFGLGWELFN
ncbi:MAG: putative porin [Ignavibacteriaceae bacterium]